MGWPGGACFPPAVRSIERHVPDWRDAAAYAPLLGADRSIFAWEWLRRDPAYRAAAQRAAAEPCRDVGNSPAADHWGLHAFVHPSLASPAARPLWRADIHPAVLPVIAAGPDAPSDAFDLDRFASMAVLHKVPERREHLLLSDGLRAIRLDILAGTVTAGPARLRYLLSGFAAAERPLMTLRRLMALQRAGRFSRSLHRPERRARRWVLMLRAHDAIAAGSDQREIAAALLSRTARELRWRSVTPSLRSQVQRLVRASRQMATDGYRELLR